MARTHRKGTCWRPRRLVLRSGRMTLGLLSGVTLTAEGPADLELLSIDRVHCRRGKLRTRVPRGAEGFIVTTPGSAVVDLGTEFGLNVAADGKAHLMVFKGEAEAAVLNAAGAPVRSQQVTARRAFEIDPGSGQIEEAEARPVDFVAPPILAPSPLGLGGSYRAGGPGRRPLGLLALRGDRRRRDRRRSRGSPAAPRDRSREARRRGRPQPLCRVRPRRGRAEPGDGRPLGAAERPGIRRRALGPSRRGSATPRSPA